LSFPPLVLLARPIAAPEGNRHARKTRRAGRRTTDIRFVRGQLVYVLLPAEFLA